MDFPIFDLHCDTALALLGNNYAQCGSLQKNELHIDLERASSLPGYAQCFACFTTTADTGCPISPIDCFERELATVMREVEKNRDKICQAFSASDVEANKDAGLMSAILTIEGPAGFGFDPALLEDLYNVGFRITTLGWNEKNPLTGSHVTGGGLTDLGREYVKEAQRLGMIVDVSHISDEGFFDILDITNAPIIASHSNSRSIWNCSRNITDEMFVEICRVGGVIGLNAYTAFLGEQATLETMCDHVKHFLDLDPTGKHIAFGGDLDGCETLPDGFNGVQSYPALIDVMLRRGFDRGTIYDICWNNAMEVMKRCCI